MTRPVQIRDGALSGGAIEGDLLPCPVGRLDRLFDAGVKQRWWVVIGSGERREFGLWCLRILRDLPLDLEARRTLIANGAIGGL